MNIVYFTAAESLADGDLRRQCIRIPEVLSRISRSQEEHLGWDLVGSLVLDDVHAKLSGEKQRILHEIVQHGIFERWMKERIPYAERLRRFDFRTSKAVVRELQRLKGEDRDISVFVIGPGYDEVCSQLMRKGFTFFDVIAQDPALSWFWPEMKKALQA